MAEKIAVFVAWPYVSGSCHLGHIAGAYLPPDIFARYHRLKGSEVLMVSGSDTHGTPITVRAEQEGVLPKQIVERYHNELISCFAQLGLSFDLFTYTDTENHYRVAQDMFLKLLSQGYIYKKEMETFYCQRCRRSLPDRYVEGTCPYCDFPEARGDQCDNCGKPFDALKLIEPRCRFCHNRPAVRQTEHFFLDLSQFQQPLLNWVNKQKHWRPNVANFTLNLLKEGLRGRPITRDIDWGIPVPVKDYEHKRIYVWFEAVIGYLSATIEWAQNNGEPDSWTQWWQKPIRSYYFIAKDNIPFHTIIWPAMLMGHGDLNLPYDIPANEYLTLEGQKFSTSRNWAVWLPDYLSRHAPDPLRYSLTINAPESRDTDFSWKEFWFHNNNELVATWGNLVHRILTFTYKNFDRQVPTPGKLDEADRTMLAKIEEGFGVVGQLIEQCRFKAALSAVMKLTAEANRYFDSKTPWVTIKTNPQTTATTLFVCLRVIDSLKTLFLPFLPFSSQALHQMLGYNGDIAGESEIKTFQEKEESHQALVWKKPQKELSWSPSQLPSGQQLLEPYPLFKKLDESVVEEEMAHLEKGD
jgi:methionyl-tRNA synthetase